MLPKITLCSEDKENVISKREEDLSIKDLWENLMSKDILYLQELFDINGGSSKNNEEKADLLISRDQFISAISEIFGSGRFDPAATLVFNAALAHISASAPTMSSSSTPTVVSAFTAFKTSVTSSSSSNTSFNESILSLPQGITPTAPAVEVEDRVPWNAILRQFVQFTKSSATSYENSSNDRLPLRSPAKYLPLPYIHREEFFRVKFEDSSEHFFVIGTKGLLMMFNQSFQLLKKSQIMLRDPALASGESFKKIEVCDPWVSCSSLMGSRMVVMATVASVVHIIKDSRSTGLYEILRITDLPSIPTALHSGMDTNEWWIAIGTEGGSISLLKSVDSFEAFLRKARRGSILKWSEVISLIDIFDLKKAHKEAVREIVYNPKTDSIATCSRDSSNGLLVTRPYKSAHKYLFSIQKGVRTMAVEWSLHIIATVCGDGFVRTWNPFVTSAPLMQLLPSFAHDPPLDIIIVSHKSLLVVLFTDSFLGVWSLENVKPLQTMMLKIPGSQKWNAISKPLSVTPTGSIVVLGHNHVAFVSSSFVTSDLSHFGSGLTTGSASIVEGKANYFTTSVERNDELSPLTSHVKMEEESADPASVSFDDKGRELMRRMVRQGAPFCCLKLFEIQKPKIRNDLPVPKRLAALELSLVDPVSFLAHLAQSAKLN